MYKRIKNPWIGKEGYNCIGCSPDNPIGLHMQFYVEDDKTLVATWNPSKNYEGWIGVVHGGIQALMMDEVVIKKVNSQAQQMVVLIIVCLILIVLLAGFTIYLAAKIAELIFS